MLWYRTEPGSDPFYYIYSSKEWLREFDNPVLDFPLFIEIEFTNHCNLSCLFCSHQLIKSKGYMEWPVFKKIIDEARERKTPLRIAGWGEPLMHKEAVKFISYATDNGVKTKIYTNGLLLNEKLTKALFEAGLTELQFSMQGLNESQYETIRKGASFKKLRDNIIGADGLRKKGNYATFLSILTSVTGSDLKQVTPEMFVEDWKGYVDKIAVDLTNFNFVKHIEEVKPFLEDQILTTQHKKCVDIFLKSTIAWNGDIIFCPNQYEHLPDYTVGNIRSMTIKEAWHSDKMERHRDDVGRNLLHDTKRFCKDCFPNTTKYEYLKQKLS